MTVCAVQGERDCRVTGELMGDLRMDATAGHVRDKRVPQGVEVGETAGILMTSQKPILPSALATVALGHRLNPTSTAKSPVGAPSENGTVPLKHALPHRGEDSFPIDQ